MIPTAFRQKPIDFSTTRQQQRSLSPRETQPGRERDGEVFISIRSFLRLHSILFAALITLFALPSRAGAWNNVGHRAIAEVAWRQMSQKERRAASDLLKQHPHYQQLLIADVPRGVDTNEWAFLTAAVWPDLVRHAKPGQPQKPHSITKYDVYPH